MKKRALIIIDIQNDYFADGKWALHNIDEAASNAARVLADARADGDLVIHVHHEFLMENPPFFAPNTDGAKIHASVAPQDNEAKVLKNQVNSFYETNLKALLDDNAIENVTLVGAMSHMCIDSAARAASDFGFRVTVIEDACASRDLEFQDKIIPARHVHAAYMSALGFAFANITTTESYLS